MSVSRPLAELDNVYTLSTRQESSSPSSDEAADRTMVLGPVFSYSERSLVKTFRAHFDFEEKERKPLENVGSADASPKQDGRV